MRAGLSETPPFLCALLCPLLLAWCVPTWEISVRMMVRNCLPWPRASMSLRNSFLSSISFTTAKGDTVRGFCSPVPYAFSGFPAPHHGPLHTQMYWERLTLFKAVWRV